MINILVFGDSNSWGYTDKDQGKRYNNRWPIILSKKLNNLGIKSHIHEDCLPGRTTNISDPIDGDHFNGASVFKSTLLAHSPIDLILLMLGTNDLKKRFNREPVDVGLGIKELINISKSTNSGKGSWHDENKSELIVITPPTLSIKCSDKNWINYDDWINAYEKSKKLQSVFKKICLSENVEIIDSNNYVETSELDPIHWSKESHHKFGKGISKAILEIIKF